MTVIFILTAVDFLEQKKINSYVSQKRKSKHEKKK